MPVHFTEKKKRKKKKKKPGKLENDTDHYEFDTLEKNYYVRNRHVETTLPSNICLYFKVAGSITTHLSHFHPCSVIVTRLRHYCTHHLPPKQKESESTTSVKTSLRGVCTASRVPASSFPEDRSPGRIMAESLLVHTHAHAQTLTHSR